MFLNINFNFISFFISEVFLFFSILLLLLFSTFYFNDKIIKKKYIKNIIEIVKNLSLLILFLYFYLTLINTNTCVLINTNLISYNEVIKITKIVLIIINIWILLQEKSLKIYKIFFFEISILFLSSLLGFSLMLSFNDLILIYLFIELQSLIFFILTSIQRKIISFDAGLKYFIYGVIASSLILYGISLIYGVYGTINLYYLGILFETLYKEENNVLFTFVYCFTFIIIGILIKLGSFPFYGWVPHVYSGSLITITAYFSTISYISYSILLLNFFIQSYSTIFNMFTDFFYFICIGSVLTGIVGAFYQVKIKNFMAYNSILNIGFIILSLLNYFLAKNFISNVLFVFIFIYIVSYCLINAGLWGILLSSISNKNNLTYLTELKILYLYNPVLIYLFIICLVSMSGLPPTIGFIAKFFLICSAVSTNFKFLSFIVLLLSTISIFYYLRIIKMVVFDIYEFNISLVIKSFNLCESLSISIILHLLFFYPFYFNLVLKFLKINLFF